MSTKKKTIQDIVQKANQIHNNAYDYSKSVYINMHTKIIINCPEHGEFNQTPADHIHKKAGCKICAKQSRINTSLEKYGTSHPRQNQDVKNKQHQTNLNRYGCHPTQTKQVQDKMKQTMMERYGVEYALQSPEILQSMKNHNLQNHGFEWASQNPEIVQKMKQTWISKYGVDNPTKSEVIKNKTKMTNELRYGGHPRQHEDVKNKQRQTNIKKYGSIYHSQKNMIDILPQLQEYDWLFNQYITQNKSSDQIAKELNVGGTTILRYLRNHEIEIKQIYTYSYKQINWLTSIMERDGINIQHAINGGEYQIPGTRYKADGYCQDTNTIYEFHGDYWHGNPLIYENSYYNECTNCTMGELYQRTIKKEQVIRELGYNLVVEWENSTTKLEINQ